MMFPDSGTWIRWFPTLSCSACVWFSHDLKLGSTSGPVTSKQPQFISWTHHASILKFSQTVSFYPGTRSVSGDHDTISSCLVDLPLLPCSLCKSLPWCLEDYLLWSQWQPPNQAHLLSPPSPRTSISLHDLALKVSEHVHWNLFRYDSFMYLVKGKNMNTGKCNSGALQRGVGNVTKNFFCGHKLQVILKFVVVKPYCDRELVIGIMDIICFHEFSEFMHNKVCLSVALQLWCPRTFMGVCEDWDNMTSMPVIRGSNSDIAILFVVMKWAEDDTPSTKPIVFAT